MARQSAGYARLQEIFSERLALLADVAHSYVGRIERGHNNAVVLTLVRLAGALVIIVASSSSKRASDI